MTERRNLPSTAIQHAQDRLLDPALHEAFRITAASTERSGSELVNAACRASLTEDAGDVAAFATRAMQPSVAFEGVLTAPKRRGNPES